MLFFMTRERFENYLEEHRNQIVEQYSLDVISGLTKQVRDNGNEFRNDICGLKTKVSELEKINAIKEANGPELEQYVESVKMDIRRDVRNDVMSEITSTDIDADGVKELVARTVSEKLSDISSEWETKITDSKNVLRSELDNRIGQYIRTSLSRLSQELDIRDRENQQLKATINIEKQNSAKLIKYIQKQENEITRLSELIVGLQREFGDLSKRIDGLTLFSEDFDSKTSESQERVSDKKALKPIVPEAVVQIKSIPVFTENTSDNVNVLKKFILETQKLKTQFKILFGDSEEGIIYFKLIDKCIRKMETLEEKNNVDGYEAEKLANESAKIFNQTIAKAMSQEKLRKILDQYMQACNIRKLDWSVGKLLDNDDYEYLEEPILYSDVSDPKLNNTITEIRQDTYIIDYTEDNNQFEAVIPGIYSIGKYRG